MDVNFNLLLKGQHFKVTLSDRLLLFCWMVMVGASVCLKFRWETRKAQSIKMRHVKLSEMYVTSLSSHAGGGGWLNLLGGVHILGRLNTKKGLRTQQLG